MPLTVCIHLHCSCKAYGSCCFSHYARVCFANSSKHYYYWRRGNYLNYLIYKSLFRCRLFSQGGGAGVGFTSLPFLPYVNYPMNLLASKLHVDWQGRAFTTICFTLFVLSQYCILCVHSNKNICNRYLVCQLILSYQFIGFECDAGEKISIWKS